MARPELLPLLPLLPLLLLLLAVPVTVAASVTTCNPGECLSTDLCCRCCPAGHFVTKLCQENHGIAECAPCEPETFMASPNLEQACFPCSQCQKDQEVVSNCSLTTNRQCQCKKGYYCDSENCVEHCFRCSSCLEGRAVLEPCHPRANTVCAKMNQASAIPDWSWIAPAVIVIIPFNIIIFIIFIIFIIRKHCRFGTAPTHGPELETSCDQLLNQQDLKSVFCDGSEHHSGSRGPEGEEAL